MEMEIKDRAALLKHGNGKADGYAQPQGGMNYQQPGHPQQNGQKY